MIFMSSISKNDKQMENVIVICVLHLVEFQDLYSFKNIRMRMFSVAVYVISSLDDKNRSRLLSWQYEYVYFLYNVSLFPIILC